MLIDEPRFELPILDETHELLEQFDWVLYEVENYRHAWAPDRTITQWYYRPKIGSNFRIVIAHNSGAYEAYGSFDGLPGIQVWARTTAGYHNGVWTNGKRRTKEFHLMVELEKYLKNKRRNLRKTIPTCPVNTDAKWSDHLRCHDPFTLQNHGFATKVMWQAEGCIPEEWEKNGGFGNKFVQLLYSPIRSREEGGPVFRRTDIVTEYKRRCGYDLSPVGHSSSPGGYTVADLILNGLPIPDWLVDLAELLLDVKPAEEENAVLEHDSVAGLDIVETNVEHL